MNYASSREAADRVVEIIAAGGKAIAVQGDMSKAADVDQFFARKGIPYTFLFASLMVLIFGAGLFAVDTPVAKRLKASV